MKLPFIRYRCVAGWEEVRDSYDPTFEGGGASTGVMYPLTRTKKKRKVRGNELLWSVEIWHGLFGGAHDGNMPVRSGTSQVYRTPVEDWYVALSHGQVQEITLTPEVDGERIPGQVDLHQLTPSQSFLGTTRIWYPEPIELTRGMQLGVRWLASQEDRGVHCTATFFTTKVE